ncbi:MAG: tripartite tricarboxylate transporter permease [Chloroflexi bacterium]|nr:tripartite tricarboxylate transporter permease [Chloroflexota bacterium]
MWEASISAAQHLFSPGPLIAFAIITPIALFNGVMIAGGVPVFILLLSFAAQLDPFIALPAAVFYAAANDATEPIPSILIGVPGSRGSQATIIDGYPMSRQGRAGEALGAVYVSSLIGGILGAAMLMTVLPIARELLKLFGAAEFFLLSLLGIATVALLSSGAMVKGLLTAAFGLAIALIGFSPIGGVVRANMGIGYLWDGLPLVPVLLGVFAIPELANLVVSNTTIATERLDEVLSGSSSGVKKGMGEAMRHKWLITRSSLIGAFVGMMPGLGAVPAHWIAYAQARQTEQGATETFGTGDIRGVIAPEASNNAIDGGVLVPTLFFSIPGSPNMALILAMLILVGIQPGPPMLNQHLDLTVALVWTIVLANIIVVPIVLRFAPLIARVTVIPPNILFPLVMAIIVIGVYQSSQSVGDLWLFAGAGVLGLFMKAYAWPRPPIVIAIVLANEAEKWLWIATNTYGWEMFLRWQFLTIIAFVILGAFVGIRVQRSASRIRSQEAQPDEEAAVLSEEDDDS